VSVFCRCDGPMPIPDESGDSPIGAMCFGCDKPMDEASTVGLYDDPVVEEVGGDGE
jgi:hypothetical protein